MEAQDQISRALVEHVGSSQPGPVDIPSMGAHRERSSAARAALVNASAAQAFPSTPPAMRTHLEGWTWGSSRRLAAGATPSRWLTAAPRPREYAPERRVL